MRNSESSSATNVDIADVKEMFHALIQEGRVQDAASMMDAVFESLETLRQKNSELELKLSQLLRKVTGRKSEKIAPGQLSLFLGNLDSLSDEITCPPQLLETEKEKPKKKKKRKKKGHGRKPIPDNLPRRTRDHRVEGDARICTCGKEKTTVSWDVSYELEFHPAHFEVIEDRREVVACRPCGGEMERAPGSDRVIEGSYAGPGLLSQVMVSKYVDHNPLHRIKRIFERSGVDISVSTLSGWVVEMARQLGPIAALIQAEVLASHLVQTDDTGIKVLMRGQSKGQNIHKGHMWIYIGDQRYACYEYTPTRENIGPANFLKSYEGWLQADAYAGYDICFDRDRGGKADEVGCWSHARRYFRELVDTDPRAAVAINAVSKLYDIEREATKAEMNTEQRLKLRKDRAPPILEALRQWLGQVIQKEPPKSGLSKAARYMVNQWTALNRFLEDGALPLDNNGSERGLRVIALGRKNYLFAGSEAGAKAAATMYTIFGTCSLNGVDPWAYLQDVIQKLTSGWKMSRLPELLPPVWAQQHSEQSNA